MVSIVLRVEHKIFQNAPRRPTGRPLTRQRWTLYFQGVPPSWRQAGRLCVWVERRSVCFGTQAHAPFGLSQRSWVLHPYAGAYAIHLSREVAIPLRINRLDTTCEGTVGPDHILRLPLPPMRSGNREPDPRICVKPRIADYGMKVAAAYHGGACIAEIARRYGFAHTTVARWIREAGITRDPNLVSLSEASRRLGISFDRLRSLMDRFSSVMEECLIPSSTDDTRRTTTWIHWARLLHLISRNPVIWLWLPERAAIPDPEVRQSIHQDYCWISARQCPLGAPIYSRASRAGKPYVLTERRWTT